MSTEKKGPPAPRPLPAPDGQTAPYWEAARQHRLALPRCLDCGTCHFYPRSLCPQCGSPRLEWTDCSGQGTVYSFSVVHRAPSPALAAETPYVLAAVQLREGPHMMSRIIGCPPDDVRIGMAVEVSFLDLGESTALPVFAPAAREPAAGGT